MRPSHLFSSCALALLLIAATHAAPPKVVYLYGVAGLEQLRHDNPAHYERARRILASAPQICAAGPAALHDAGINPRGLRCLQGFLRTSNPPQQEIDFQLDDTHYIAFVFVTGAAPALKPAR